MKSLFYLFVLLAVVFGLERATVHAGDGDFPKTKYEVTIGLRSSPPAVVSNFPLKMRSVPRHSDDDYLKGSFYANEPLPNDTLILHEPSCLEITFTHNLNYDFCWGLILSVHFNEDAAIDSDQRHQQNQWGDDDRVYGASLRWYQITTRALQLRSFFAYYTPRKKIISNNLSCRLKLGGILDLTGLRIAAEGGWDRYSADESWDIFTVAKLYEHGLFSIFELDLLDKGEKEAKDKYIIIYAGYYLPLYYFSKVDSEIVIDMGDDCHWFGGLGLAF